MQNKLYYVNHDHSVEELKLNDAHEFKVKLDEMKKTKHSEIKCGLSPQIEDFIESQSGHRALNKGHLANFYISELDEIYFIDAQQGTISSDLPKEILRGDPAWCSEFFYLPFYPPEGHQKSAVSSSITSTYIKPEPIDEDTQYSHKKRSRGMITHPTMPNGDCAFHALFGSWDKDKKYFICPEALAFRKKLSAKIASYKFDAVNLNDNEKDIKKSIEEGIATR